jgi:hypothetical protein
MTAAAEMSATPYAEHAFAYLQAGWSPIPLPTGQKGPPQSAFTGGHGAMVSGADVQEWIDNGIYWQTSVDGKTYRKHGPAGNIAIRLPLEIIGVDVDMYMKGGQQKAGRASLAELEAAFGPLPPTYMSSARTEGSGIRFFQVPPGLAWPGAPKAGIEIIQFRHRYAVVAPSWNPEAEAAYRWIDPDGNTFIGIPAPEDMAWMPDGWIEGLTHGELAGEVERDDLSDGQALSWMRAHRGDEAMCPGMQNAMRKAIDGYTSGDRYIPGIITSGHGARHDAATRATAALAHLAAEGHPGVTGALRAAQVAFQAVTVGEERPGEWQRMVTGAIGVASARGIATVGDPCRDPYTGSNPHITERANARVHPMPGVNGTSPATTVSGFGNVSTVSTPPGGGEDFYAPPPSEDFWKARPELDHIRSFAQARRVAPWATLGVAMLRLLTCVPPFVVLPAIVGDVASLNSFVALVGPSGGGKGRSTAAARRAFVLPDEVEEFGAGSGEGVGHLFMKRQKIPADQGGGTSWQQIRKAVMVDVPEVDMLTALGSRQGATLMSILRQAWSGETLSFAYADQEKAFTIRANTYRLSMIVGVQPGRAGNIMDDADGGTPQRFIWMPTHDPYAPRIAPMSPEPWEWKITGTWKADRPGEAVMSLPDSVVEEISEKQYNKLLNPTFDLDAHGTLAKEKVAAALALLAGRNYVTLEDWDLASVVMAISDGQRQFVQDVLSYQRRQKAEVSGTAEAHKQIRVEEMKETARLIRVCRNIRAHTPGSSWIARNDLRRSIATRDRDIFDQAVESLLKTGAIVRIVSPDGAESFRQVGN